MQTGTTKILNGNETLDRRTIEMTDKKDGRMV